MSEEDRARETAKRLRRLVDTVQLSDFDRGLAGQCLRRIEQPLRLTIFGTDVLHSVSLLNLMIGQSVISPEIKRARIQFVHGAVPHARLLFRDGSQKRIEGADFRRLFDENPNRMRICVDLPVLRKISITVAADRNPKALCADADKTLASSDIALWSGSELQEPMQSLWARLPTRLRDHSYIVPTPTMDLSSWSGIESEFAGVIKVAPRRAQKAKSGPDGADKAAFREAGGTRLVKTIKSEIEMLIRSAIDMGEVLLMRHASEPGDISGNCKSRSSEISAETARELIAEMRVPRARYRQMEKEREAQLRELHGSDAKSGAMQNNGDSAGVPQTGRS